MLQKRARTGSKPGPRFQPPDAPPRECPNCAALNAATFKFCARCGTPLAPGAAAALSPLSRLPAAVPSPAARPNGERPARPAPARASGPPPRPGPGPRPGPAALKGRARISAIARDGTRSADYLLTKDETRIGRAVPDGEIQIDEDSFVAPIHALLRFEGDQLTVHDPGTPNGVFLWCRERQLSSGDELRIGRQRLRVEWMPEEPETLAEQPLWGSPDPGYVARVVQLLEGGGEGDVFPLKPGENLVGRGSGDVSFPQDGYVSGKHAVIAIGEHTIAVKDLGSANGTFVKVSAPTPLAPGDVLLVGEQILRVDPT